MWPSDVLKQSVLFTRRQKHLTCCFWTKKAVRFIDNYLSWVYRSAFSPTKATLKLSNCSWREHDIATRYGLNNLPSWKSLRLHWYRVETNFDLQCASERSNHRHSLDTDFFLSLRICLFLYKNTWNSTYLYVSNNLSGHIPEILNSEISMTSNWDFPRHMHCHIPNRVSPPPPSQLATQNNIVLGSIAAESTC